LLNDLSSVIRLTEGAAALILAGAAGLFAVKLQHVRMNRQSARYLQKHREYFSYLAAHVGGEEPLMPPPGQLAALEKEAIRDKLVEWMERIRGEERWKLIGLYRDMGLAGEDMKTLKEGLHWMKVEAAHRLGVLRVQEAVPALLDLLRKEKYGPSLFIIARAIAKSARTPGVLREMTLVIAGHKKPCHELVADVLHDSSLDLTPFLESFLDEEDPDLQMIALLGLRGYPCPRLLPAFERLLETGSRSMRRKAVQAALEPVGIIHPQKLRELSRDKDEEIRLEAARVMGRIGTEDMIPHLLGGLKDKLWRVRYESARSLYRLGEAGVEALCRTAVKEENLPSGQIAKNVLIGELRISSARAADFPEEILPFHRCLNIYRRYFPEPGHKVPGVREKAMAGIF